MITNWKAPILALLGLGALAVAIPVGVANAQQGSAGAGGNVRGQGGQGGQGGGFQGGPPQDMRPDGGMQRMGMMGGGQATMVTDQNFLFILQGNTLYKVNKNSLEVIGTGQLPMPGPRFEGGPGGAGPRGGGGGAGTRGGGGGGEEQEAK